MAEGRMLKRNISESRRLSQLKTDSARLLWTWIIPFLDSEGRFYASPDMIKGKIVPRIESFSLKNIPKYIEDMARVGLITLYQVDGEKLIQYRKFDTFQKIVKSREATPLPAPEEGSIIEIKSGLTQDKIESESRLPVPNLREVNLREVNSELLTTSFKNFWENYPSRNGKKLGKDETWERYLKLKESDLKLINKAVLNYSQSEQVKAGIGIKDPKRFIWDANHHEPWRDWIEPEIKPFKPKQSSGPKLRDWSKDPPPEYDLTDEQRRENIKKLKELIKGIGEENYNG